MGLVQFPHCSAAIFRRSFMGWAQTYGQGSIPSLPSTASSPLPCATQHWLQQEQGWRKAPVSKRGWELPAEFARTVMEQEQAMMQTAELIFFFFNLSPFSDCFKKNIPCSFHYKPAKFTPKWLTLSPREKVRAATCVREGLWGNFILSPYEIYYFLT